jgi:hypothetical protein
MLKRMTRTLIASTVLVALCAAMLAAQAPAPPTGSARAVSFVSALAQALSRNDRAAVADMVRYPAAATAGGIGIPITTRADLLRLYDGVFSAELRCLVEDSVAQGAGAIRVDGGGVSFGDGRIRAQDAGGTLKITHITVPPISAVAAPPPSAPRRVTVRRGDVQYSGRLYGDGVDSYILSAQRGDVVQARIEKFPGRSAAIRVVEQKTGKALGQPGASAPRLWSGTIQEPGEYHIDVVRLAPHCMPSFTYLLTITIK